MRRRLAAVSRKVNAEMPHLRAAGAKFGSKALPAAYRARLAIGRKIAIFVIGAGTDLPARPLFLAYDQDPDPNLPAGPGPFHI